MGVVCKHYGGRARYMSRCRIVLNPWQYHGRDSSVGQLVVVERRIPLLSYLPRQVNWVGSAWALKAGTVFGPFCPRFLKHGIILSAGAVSE